MEGIINKGGVINNGVTGLLIMGGLLIMEGEDY